MPIPSQHPALVLRSHYKAPRGLLAIAMIAVIGLTAVVVILAAHHDRDPAAGAATQVSAPPAAGTTRYDSDPEEGTRGVPSANSRAARGSR